MSDFVARLVFDAARQLHAEQVGRLLAGGIERPVKLLVANRDAVRGVEALQNVFAGTQAEGAQENRAQEFAFAVDADIEHVLLVVLELYPGTAVGNDLAKEVGAIVRSFEEDAGRTVQLADDHALGAVDDERTVLRHQRNIAEKYFLLFDVANGTIAGLRVLIENGQTHGDLERGGVGHAALFALGDVIFQLQANGVAAFVAEIRRVGVVGTALLAENFPGMKGIGNDGGSAITAGGTEVMQTFEVPTFALPVTNGVIHKLKL